MLNLLSRLGLGHLLLNQELATLSGGENQRIKLAVNLNNNTTRIFGLDEPTRGLGSGDAEKMMGLLYDKVKEDNKTFIIVEHNKSVLDACSYVQTLKRENNVVKIY